MLGLIRPSGGLLYHWRARRQSGRWDPFRKELAEWLAGWNIPKQELILIGPSAGYTLPTGWLTGFSKITAYDLDPLAPWLFSRNHPGAHVQFKKINLFWQGGCLSLLPLRELITRHPRSPILFTNVLGQVLLEGRASDFEWSVFLRGLRALLNNHRWASYHDRLTHEGGETIDHLTGGDWIADLEVRPLRWQLTRKALHEIDAVRV